MKKAQQLAQPRTSKEAKILMDRAAACGEFEAAEKYYNDYHDLILFEEEMGLGKIVTGYFDLNQQLSNNLEENCTAYRIRIEETQRNATERFENEFERVKKRQQEEIDDIVEEWKHSREIIARNANMDFNQAMTTARIVAQTYNFKEAQYIKKEAMKNRINYAASNSQKMDEHYKRQIEMATKRHKFELDKLISEYKIEMHTYEKMLNEAKLQAQDAFHVETAGAVVTIAHKFKAEKRMPISLRMQTVNAQPKTPNSQSPSPKTHESFDYRMKYADHAISSPIQMRSQSRESAHSFENV